MLILGVADVPAPAAAVVRDDALVAVVSAEQMGLPDDDDTPIPWAVIDEAMHLAGATPADVDVVAFAGRFSPPLALRQRPWLRRIVTAATSPLLDLTVAWQALLRHSGLGAYAADVAAEWLDGRFRDRGFAHHRLLTVDVHKALAEAAYRNQPEDEALVVVLQPMGDGVGLSVHRGRAGQVDRLWFQRGFEAVHVHLPRALHALDFAPGESWMLEGLAARGTVDPKLQALLAERLYADGRSLSQRPLWGGRGATDATAAALRAVPRVDAAASVLDNLADAVTTVVRRLARAHGIGTVALAGEAFDHPRLVARVGETDGVERVHVMPRPGRDALAIGAAVSQAGLAPRLRDLRLGPELDVEASRRALAAAGLGAERKATLVERLVRGEALVRARERPGPGRHGQGERVVLVRADDPAAIARVRAALGRPEHEEPLCIVVPTANEGSFPAKAALAGPLAVGMAAPLVDDSFRRRYGPSVSPDGRVPMMRVAAETHPGLHQLIKALLRSSGCGAVAAFPLIEGAGPGPGTPADILALYRRSGLSALQLGPFYVESEPS